MLIQRLILAINFATLNQMKILCVLSATMLTIFGGCNQVVNSQSSKNKITKIALTSALPYYDLRINQQVSNEDTVNVYFIDSLIILQKYILHGEFVEEVTDNPDADTVNMVLVSERYLSNFFLYTKGDQYGVYTDSVGNEKKLLVDSFLRKNTPQFFADPGFKKGWELISKKKDGSILTEKYASLHTNNISFKKDSMVLSFDKSYRKIGYSILSFLDSSYDSKLYELRAIVCSYFDSARNIEIPRQEIYVKLVKQEVTESESVFLRRLIEKLKPTLLRNKED